MSIDPHGMAVTVVLLIAVVYFLGTFVHNRHTARWNEQATITNTDSQATQNEMMKLKSLKDIDPVHVSWGAIMNMANSMGVELMPATGGLDAAYSGEKHSWAGVLRGDVNSVLSVIAMGQQVVPVVVGKFDVNEGVMAVSLSVIGVEND